MGCERESVCFVAGVGFFWDKLLGGLGSANYSPFFASGGDQLINTSEHIFCHEHYCFNFFLML